MKTKLLLLTSLGLNLGLGVGYLFQSSPVALINDSSRLGTDTSVLESEHTLSSTPIIPPSNSPNELTFDSLSSDVFAWVQSQEPSHLQSSIKPLSIYHQHHLYSMGRIPLYEKWILNNPEEALTFILNIGESRSFIDLALWTWHQSNPNNVESYIRNHPHIDQQKKLVYSWARVLSRKANIQKAIDWAMSWDLTDIQEHALHGAFIGQAQSNPEKAYLHWKNYQQHQQAKTWLNSILYVWGKTSPEAAIQISLNIPQELWRADALLNATKAWSHYAPLDALKFKCQYPQYLKTNDPTWSRCATSNWQETLSLGKQLKDDLNKAYIMTNLARTRLKTNPSEAWQLVLQHSKVQDSYLISDLFKTWTRHSISDAKAAALSAPHHFQAKAIQGIAKGLAGQKPDQAISFAKEHLSHSLFPITLASIITEWSKVDLNAALNYLENKVIKSEQDGLIRDFIQQNDSQSLMENTHFLSYLEKSSHKAIYQKYCISAILRHHFELANEWFHNMEESQEKRSLLSTFTSTLAQIHPQQAWDWTANLKDKNLRLDAQKRLLNFLSNDQPLYAYEYIQKLSPDQLANFEDVYRRLIQNLSKHDPKKAYHIANSKSLSDNYTYIYENIFQEWGKKNFNEAIAAISTLKDENILVSSQQGLINGLIKTNPELAISLMKDWGTISQHISSFIQNWSHHDPQAANNWASLNKDLLKSQTYLFKQILNNWKQKDSIAANNFLNNLEEDKQKLFQDPSQQNSSNDNNKTYLEKAADLANLSVNEKSDKANSFIYSWANKNPQEAYQWLNEQEGQLKKKYLSNVLSSWASKEPNSFIQYLQNENDIPINSSLSYSLAQNLAKSDLETTKTWIDNMNTGENRSSALRGLAYSWGQKDPSQAIEWVSKLSPGSDRDSGITSIMSSWIGKDQETAIQWAQSLGSIRDRERTISHIISNIASKNIDKSIDLLNGISTQEYRQSALRPIAEHLTKADPKTAIEWAENFTDHKEREQVIKTSARLWSTTDLEGYKEWVSGINNDNERNSLLADAIQANSYKDIDATKDLINLMDEGRSKNDMARNLVSNWSSKHPKAAAEWIQNQESSSLRKKLYEQLMSNWSRYDHKGAAEFVTQLPEDDLKDSNLARSITQNWSKYEPEEAITWALQLPEGKSRTNAVSSWVDTVRKSQPFLASDIVSQNSELSITSYVYERMVQDMAKSDLYRTTTWMDNLEDPKLKERALSGISSHLLNEDPYKAIEWASSQNNSKGMEQVLKKWVSKDYLQAATYMKDNDIANKNAVRQLVSKWRSRDQPALEQWLNDLPQGQIKNQAIPSYISSIAYRDPKHAKTFLDQVSGKEYNASAITVFRYMSRQSPSEAAGWFSEMSQNSPTLSQPLLTSLASYWMPKDKEAAILWGSNLSEEQHQKDYYYNVSRTLKISSVEKMTEWLPKVPTGTAQNAFIEYAVKTYHASNKNLSREFLNYLNNETARQELSEKYNL